MNRMPAILLILLLLAPTAAVAPRAETPSVKTIRHWTGGCDNLRSCSAFGFATFLHETMTGAWIRLDRDGGANAAPVVSFSFMLADGSEDVPQKMTIARKGGPSFGPLTIEQDDAGIYRADIPAAKTGAMLDWLRTGDFLQLTASLDKGSPIDATLSLDGAAGMLLWIDDQQQRIGTVTAMIKKGAKPASAVPAVPPLPVIHRAASTKPVEQTLPPAILDLAKQGDCADMMQDIEPIVADLGRGRTLYGALCGSGAYNFAAPFWIVTDGGAPEAASFPLPESLIASDDGGDAPELHGVLVNPFFDEETMSIHSFANGRGIGDCGSAGEWVWDGTAFRLTQYSLMTECEGIPSDAWPVLYRAEVK